jgi:dihydroxyacetone kinase-like predicted kinase
MKSCAEQAGLVEGMEKCLYGEEITSEKLDFSTATVNERKENLFNSDSIFEVGYCMEFLLQLLKCRQAFRLDEYIKALQTAGDSLVCVQNDEIVKVHIHTKTPAIIIEESQRYGEFRTFKLENMQIQCDEMMSSIAVSKNAEHKQIAIIAISNGDGIKELFDSFGCDVVIDGGKTMNTSAKEILNALQSVSADKILLFPNHENIVKAAEQAIILSKLDNVVIMPSRNVMECYYALAMDIGDGEDADERVQAMEEGCKGIQTFEVTQCVKDCVCNGVVCAKGEYVVLEKGKPIACVKDYYQILDVLAEKSVFQTAENCMIFTGACLEEFDESRYEQAIKEKYPDVEVSYMDGQQRIYDLIFGVI